MADSLRDVRVNVKRRSGYDKSYKNILTTKVGTITPIAYKLLIPNSDFNLKVAISASLPPLASDTFMRAALKVEAFAVPWRLLYGGVESWLTGEPVYKSSDGEAVQTRAKLPRIIVSFEQVDHGFDMDADQKPFFARGSLMDYLGFRGAPIQPEDDTSIYLNGLLPLCYHRIWNDWYRNRKVQMPCFGRPTYGSGTSPDHNRLSELPYIANDAIYNMTIDQEFFDGVALGSLRQRNYGSDYFTECTPYAQFGSVQKVTIDASDQFTIAALRAANAMQMFEEKNNISSPALQDYVKVNYGANLSSGIAQRSIYLGSASFDVYSKGVNAQSDVTATNNPFTSVGARYGNAFASGSDFIVKGHVDEPCYLMVMATLVPEANYAYGIKRDLTVFTEDGSLMDMPNPAFELIGNEPVYSYEVGDYDNSQFDTIFGFHPRYTWHKTAYNEVHGLLLEGESLEAFVAQRAIKRNSELGSDFLEIATTDLDNVTAVTADLSNYGVMIDSFIQLFVSEPLGESSLPSLVDPAAEHGASVYMRRNGSRL